jgi:hypothetical protein
MQSGNSANMNNVREIIDRCRKETGVDYSENGREQSINYVVTQGNVHCVTLGLGSQPDDAVERIIYNINE